MKVVLFQSNERLELSIVVKKAQKFCCTMIFVHQLLTVCSNPQIAAKVVLDESVKCVEQELAHLDQEFRIDRPPKKITIESEEPMAASEAEAEFAD